MKQNITTFKTSLLLAGSLALAASCQDYEPFSEQQVQDRAYTREFERKFGEIDPNQNWDLFGQLAKGVGSTTRGAANEISARWTGETMEVTLDDRMAYRTVLPEDANSKTLSYEQTNLSQVTSNFMTTARTIRFAPVHWQTSGKNTIGIFWYVAPGTPDDTYTFQGQTITVETETYFVSDGNGGLTAKYVQRVPIMSESEYKAHLKSGQGVTNNADAQTPGSNNGETTWIADIMEVTVPASIASYGFYITNSDYKVDKTKYSDGALNTKVSYLGNHDACYVATFNLKELGLSETDDQQYLCFEDWMGGESNFDMNDLVLGIKDGLDPSTIINHDATNEQAILVCEDLNDYDFDFNDIVLGLNYKEEEDYKWVDVTYTYEGQTLTYKKKQVVEGSQKRYLSVTAMAAGGAYESTVAFDTNPETIFNTENEEQGKIHALMGENPAIASPTGHNPLDPKFNATANYNQDGAVFEIPEDKIPEKGSDVGIGEGYTYPTFLSKLFANDFFKIYCTQGKANGNAVAVKLLKNSTPAYTDYVDHDIDKGPVPASAPQMMLFPWYFEWPREKVWIQHAYTGFSDWVSDATMTDWIKNTQDNQKIVERGDFVEESSGTTDPGDIVEEIPINVEQPKKFKYDESETGTFNNGVFVPIGDDVLINEGATATLKVTFRYKTEKILYFDDADGNQLFKDNSGTRNNGGHNIGSNYSNLSWLDQHWKTIEPITITYPMDAEQTAAAVNSGGIWIVSQDDYVFLIDEVALLTVTGVTDPKTVHNLTVDPTSLTFASAEAEGQTITATCNTISNISAITFVSSDETVATVSANSNGTVTVTPKAKGTATITVTAPADDNYGKRTRTVKVTVGEGSSGPSETNLTVTQLRTLEHNWQDTEYTITGPASALVVGAILTFEIEGTGHNQQADCYTADHKGGTQLINNGSSVTLTQEQINAISESVSNGTFTLYAITWGGETLKGATITPNN